MSLLGPGGCCILNADKAILHGFGVAVQIGCHAASVLPFVPVLTFVDVLGAVTGHAVDQASQLVGGSRNSFHSPKADFHAAQVRPRSTF